MSKSKLKVVQKNKGSTVCETSNGKRVVFLTPSGRCVKYQRELKKGKNSRTGEELNDLAKGYRMGYRAALGEQAKIWKKKNGKK